MPKYININFSEKDRAKTPFVKNSDQDFTSVMTGETHTLSQDRPRGASMKNRPNAQSLNKSQMIMSEKSRQNDL